MSLISQNKAAEDLGIYLPLFFKVIHLAWHEWMDIPIKTRQKGCNRTRASFVHNLMVDHATRLLPDAHLHDLAKLKLFSIKNYAVRFKKLDEELKTRNQQSAQVKKFKGQQQLEGMATTHNLEVGYCLDPFEQSIQSCHLVCPNGNKVFWDIELFEEEIQKYGGFDLFTTAVEEEVEAAPAQFKQKKKGEVLPFNKVSGNENERSDQ